MRLMALIVFLFFPQAEAEPPWPIDFGGPFALVDQQGQPRTDQDFLGRPFLITFGYTYCPDVCPIVLTIMVNAKEVIGEQVPDLDLVFVSIDPMRDTPEILADHLDLFDTDIIGLTGSTDAVEAAAKAYRVGFSRIGDGQTTNPDEYLVLHTPSVFLISGEGDFLTLFPYGTDADQMASVVLEHLAF